MRPTLTAVTGFACKQRPNKACHSLVGDPIMSDPPFDLTRYLPYLINRSGSRIADAYSATLKQHGISLQIWRVLAALHHCDGQRVSALAATTSIDVSTLSRLIGSMEKKGLARRERAAKGDARVVTVWRTDVGHRLTEDLLPLARQHEATALSGFSSDEAVLLKDFLVRVYGNLDRLKK